MRKAIIILAAAALIVSITPPALALPELSAQSCVLICAETGETLYSREPDERMLIASLTKLMTAVVVRERCSLSDVVTIDKSAVGAEGSSMYLRAGERRTVEELLYGLLLASGNDAAAALAIHVSGSIPAFAELMNQKAAELGMSASSFKNPSGLDEDGHYSTASDMASLALCAMNDPTLARIVGTKSYTAGEQTLVNHNKLLWRCEGCIGLKTGYTRAAGRTLISCAVREGARFICVTLNAPNDWEDHAALYSWAEEEYDYISAMDEGESVSLPVVTGVLPYVKAAPAGGLMALVPSGESCSLAFRLPRFVFAGVEKGDKAGEVAAIHDGREIASAPLYFTSRAEISRGEAVTLTERLREFCGVLSRPYYYVGE